MNILVVEDDEDIRDFLAELLTEEGYNVIKAAHGREALEMLEQQKPSPSLIMLDLMMPVMSGWEFCEEIEKKPDISAIPIIILSAVAKLGEIPCEMSAKAALSKPFKTGELLDLVARFAHPDGV